MPHLRISLAGLLGFIAVLALGLAGIVSASTLWTSVAATVVLAILLAAVLAARLLEGTDRVFWAGFALFGWTYLLLVNWDWVGGQFGHDLTAGLSGMADSMFAEVPIPIVPQPPGNTAFRPVPPPYGVRPVPTPIAPGTPEYLELVRRRQIQVGNFVQIGRLGLTLAFGMLGGYLATRLARRREPAATAPAATMSPPSDRGGG